MRKEWSTFGGEIKVFRDSNYKCYIINVLFDLLFTCRLKVIPSLAIFHLLFLLISCVCFVLLIAYLRRKMYKS